MLSERPPDDGLVTCVQCGARQADRGAPCASCGAVGPVPLVVDPPRLTGSLSLDPGVGVPAAPAVGASAPAPVAPPGTTLEAPSGIRPGAPADPSAVAPAGVPVGGSTRAPRWLFEPSEPLTPTGPPTPSSSALAPITSSVSTEPAAPTQPAAPRGQAPRIAPDPPDPPIALTPLTELPAAPEPPPVVATPQFVFERQDASASTPTWVCFQQVPFGGRADLLRMELRDDGHPRVPEDEEVIGLYAGRASMRVAAPDTASSALVVKALFADSPVEIVVCRTRLLVLVLGGSTILGPSEAKARNVFCLSVPLALVGAIWLERAKRRVGRPRDAAVRLSGCRQDRFSLRLESVARLAESPDARGGPGAPIAPRDVFDELRRIVVAQRQAAATPADPVLEAAARGDVGVVGDDLVSVVAGDHRDAPM